MCKAEHNSADLDKQQQQQQQQTATKPTFYRKLNHLGMLEVPDIISCIFEFLDKPSLASVSRVNRMWRRYSMPLMWRHIVDRNWRHRTFCGLIASKANWVRSLHCQMSTDYDLLLSCNMAHLNSISMRGNHDSIDTKMAIIQKASNTLSSLSLSGVALTLSTDVAQVIQGLKRLSALKITRTSITGSFVHMLLDGCPDLEFLSLRGITLEKTPHVDDEQPQLRKLDLDHPVSRILYLNLRNVDVDDDDLLYIVEACPELRELSIAGNSSLEDFSHVAKTLRKSCPHLYALDMASCVEITEDQFTVLWTMLGPQLKIVNLAGTKLGDKALALMARECQSLTRLDIQYCTNISTKGLHDFMCSVSPTLQQLEASGVTIDPEEIDDREWVCSGLEVLVIHINLFDRRQLCPGRQQENALEASSRTTTMTATANSTGTTSAVISPPPTTILEYGHAKNITSIIGSLFGSRFARGDGHHSDRAALSRLDEDVIMESPPAEVDSMNDSVSNTPWRTPDPIDTTDSDTEMIHQEQAGLIEKERQPKGSSHTAAEEMHQVQSSAATGLKAVDAALKKKLRHPHHPIQRLTKLHYLGLMGTGTAKLVKSSVGEFIEAFGQVDHLDLSGLSQAFRQEDLTWLIESLPSLFQVDAEHYHISDDLRKWCRKEFPGILIHRKER
ncbi:hypothetical protein DFQ26_008902 [Actinomortierella ambigua]|nr:hypothetical protein DFQ26_008902 [Actinomortierella ambigua]